MYSLYPFSVFSFETLKWNLHIKIIFWFKSLVSLNLEENIFPQLFTDISPSLSPSLPLCLPFSLPFLSLSPPLPLSHSPSLPSFPSFSFPLSLSLCPSQAFRWSFTPSTLRAPMTIYWSQRMGVSRSLWPDSQGPSCLTLSRQVCLETSLPSFGSYQTFPFPTRASTSRFQVCCSLLRFLFAGDNSNFCVSVCVCVRACAWLQVSVRALISISWWAEEAETSGRNTGGHLPCLHEMTLKILIPGRLFISLSSPEKPFSLTSPHQFYQNLWANCPYWESLRGSCHLIISVPAL